MFLFYLLWFFIFFFDFTLSDLCTKCYRSQTLGSWIFTISQKLYAPNIYSREIHCGHKQPNSDNTTKLLSFSRENEFQAIFEFPNNFYLYDHNGNAEFGYWTMIYNIGFFARTESHEFMGYFMFGGYPSKANNYQCNSICDKIVTSWYKNRKLEKLGCFNAEKIKLFEPEPVIFKENENFDSLIENQLLNMKYEDIEFLLEKINENTNKNNFVDIGNVEKSLEELFLLMKQKYDKDYEKANLQEIINNFKSENFYIANQAKSSYFKQDFQESIKLSNIQIDINDPVLKFWYTPIDEIPDSELPTEWDWRNINNINYMNPPRIQGKCGSCYILGSLSAIESRIKIATKNAINPNLSIMQILACSSYSEGCKGGEAFSVGKFGMDFGFIDESLFQYKNGTNAKSRKCKIIEENEDLKIGNIFTYYIGDFQGSHDMNEISIMKEIRARGPVTAGIINPLLMPYYKSGILSCNGLLLPREEYNETKQEILTRIKNGFRLVEHLVVLVGWGANEKGEKYWIVQNTWGEAYGDKGYFLLKRGENECAVETDIVAFMPSLKLQNK